MRHPLSTSFGDFEMACLLPVGGVGGFVVKDTFVQTVPEDFEPAVAGPALVAGGPLVIAGGGGQLGAGLAVRDQPAQLQVGVQGQQAAGPGVPRIVLLLRRAAAPRTRSGLTGSTVNPASARASTSSPCRVSSTPRTSAGSGSSSRHRAIRFCAPAGPWSIRNCAVTPCPGLPSATPWNDSAQSTPTPSAPAPRRFAFTDGGGTAPC